MPYSPQLLAALLVGCVVLQTWFNLHNGAPRGVVVAVVAAGAAALGMMYLLLRQRGKPERFVQTATAMAGVYLLFGAVADLLVSGLPLAEISQAMIEHPAKPPTLTGLQPLLVVVFMALGIWQFCVNVVILRRALEVPTSSATLLLVMLFLVQWFVASLVASVVMVA